jgi:hypothetical protein
MTSWFVRCSAIAALVFAAGCKSGNGVNQSGCQSDGECQQQNGGNPRWYCDTSQKPNPSCQLHPKQCDTSADCCPAQTCNATGHYCFDKYDSCTQDGDCRIAGQVCQEIGVFAKGLGCTWNKPANGTCPDGTSLFNGYCVGTAPCNGGCTNPANPVCVTATNLCTPAPLLAASCQVTCPKGQVLVLQDPTNIFDTCVESSEACACVSLPPLQVHDVARHSSMTAFGQNLFVSAYDGEHGDLVLHTFDKSNLGAPAKTEWLEGVPANGQIGGDPAGPRGGIITHGPNVGQYTSITSSATGDLYISYYDVDNRDLKFIARYGGTWTSPMTVDGSTPVGSAPSNGDVGLYSSIALDNTGIPAIAYFRRASYDAGAQSETGLSTALLYAVAKKTQPQSAADWVVIGDVDSAPRVRTPCNDSCAQGQVCVIDSTQPTGDRCGTQVTSCITACTGKQICTTYSDDPSPTCRVSEAEIGLSDLPFGTGITPSLAFLDGHPVIAYYQNVATQDSQGNVTYHRGLKAVKGTGTGATPAFSAPVMIDGDNGAAASPDTGRWPSIAIAPAATTGGRIAIGFADLSNQQLLLYQSDTLDAHAAHAGAGAAGDIHVIDNGQPAAGAAFHPQGFPGAQVSVQFTPGGQVALAYQDAQPVDLLFAKYDPAAKAITGAPTTLRAQGPAGFWPRLQIAGGVAYVSSASIKAAAANLPSNKLYIDSPGPQ